MRRAFSDTLLRLMDSDDKVVFLTGDLGFGVFDNIIARHPSRYINVGVAEAQLVNCAVGLALEGWRPLVYSIASFMTGRAFEQIRVSIGYHQVPVVVIGAGGGYTYANSGVTHHAREDFALMSLIPEMAVTGPGEPKEVELLLPELLRRNRPSYMRIGRFGEPSVESDAPVVFGRARRIREGRGIAILTTAGAVVPAAAAWETLAKEGQAPLVMHFHTLTPFDTEALDEALELAHTLVVVEDHAPKGGLEAAVASHLARSAKARRLVRLGPGDSLVLGNPGMSELSRQLGSDHDGIVRTCRELARTTS